MFLSRLILNPAWRGVQRELARPYEMHRTIQRAFPDDGGEQEARVLFRVDLPRRGGFPTLYVQSPLKPDWSFLREWEGYLAEDPDGRGNPAVREYDPALQAGQLLRFRLRANPTVTRDGKRYGLVGMESQADWLVRQGERCGFTVGRGGLRIAPEGVERMGRIKRENGTVQNPTIMGVRYDGALKVEDPESFHHMLRKGIGPGKAFGFGLLSLAPLI